MKDGKIQKGKISIDGKPSMWKSFHQAARIDNLFICSEDVEKLVTDNLDNWTLIDSAKHSPQISKKEISKFQTQQMYETWQTRAKQLRKDNPDKSISWIANKIAKDKKLNPKCRSPETIRKKIKI